MSSGPSRYAEATPRPGPDVIEAGPRRRPWPWVALAAVLVLALVWWNLGGIGGDEPAPAAEPSSTAAVPPRGAVEGVTEAVVLPEQVDSLTYADERTGFVVQTVCPDGGTCGRRIVATTDGGASWEARADVPPAADGLDVFVVVSADVIAFISGFLPSAMAVSTDGGRSFSLRTVRRGPDRPAPPGAVVVNDNPVNGAATSALSWVDIAAGSLHQLPSQPPDPRVASLVVAPRPADGDLVTVGDGAGNGRIWFSRDGGRSWQEGRLALPPPPRGAENSITLLAAGSGRAYAFVRLIGTTGLERTLGYRTDDGGRTWTDIGFEDQSLWVPTGVVAGELLSTNNPGAVYRSSRDGRDWGSGGLLPAPAYLTQTVADGPLLATLVGTEGRQTFYQSVDGEAWSLVTLPGPAR